MFFLSTKKCMFAKVSIIQRYLVCTIDQEVRGLNPPTTNIVEFKKKMFTSHAPLFDVTFHFLLSLLLPHYVKSNQYLSNRHITSSFSSNFHYRNYIKSHSNFIADRTNIFKSSTYTNFNINKCKKEKKNLIERISI